jgi:integrase
VLYDAGLRAGEACGLDVDHVDLEAGTVYLPTEVQKGSPPPATHELAPGTTRLLRRYFRDRWENTEVFRAARARGSRLQIGQAKASGVGRGRMSVTRSRSSICVCQ